MMAMDDIVRLRREREAANPRPYHEYALRQIAQRGYFTVEMSEDDLDGKPFALAMHPLPHADDARMYHNHSCFELAWVYRGACRSLGRDCEVELFQGDLLLLNPLAVHCLCTAGDTDVVFNFLLPEDVVRQTFLRILSGNPLSDFILDYLQHIRTGPDFLIVSANPSDALDALLERLVVEYHENLPGCDTILRTGLAQLFVYMARRHSRPFEALPLQRASRLVRDVMFYVARNVATATLTDVAREFSYHEKHISRQMKRELGMSFTQFLQFQRLQNAEQLLSHTNMSVTQIAHAVGYQNVSHFYVLFEQHFSATPAAWRANHRHP